MTARGWLPFRGAPTPSEAPFPNHARSFRVRRVPKRSMVLVCSSCAALLCACASTPKSPFFGDEKYLRFGVDPRAEANALIESHAGRGDKLARRIEGKDFTALGFMDAHGVPDAVRIVTTRGIALSLERDAHPLSPETRYELVPGPIDGTEDADGDGFEEIFVRQSEPRQHCLRVFRARDVGTLDEVPTVVQLFGTERCVSDVEDLDHDGRAELLVDVVLDDEDTPSAARIRAPLWAGEHRFMLDPAREAFVRFRAHEAAERNQELTDAKRALDPAQVLRIALELAALSSLAAEPSAAQLRVFDGAVAGVVLNETQAAHVLAARTRIREWNTPPSQKTARAAKNAAP